MILIIFYNINLLLYVIPDRLINVPLIDDIIRTHPHACHCHHLRLHLRRPYR